MSDVRELAGRLFVRGRLVPGRITLRAGRIESVLIDSMEDALRSGPIIAPGFVDLHVHGYGGGDPLDDLPRMALELARVGTTAFQPTLFPREPEGLGQDAAQVSAQTSQRAEGSGARVVGLHLEGPFLNPRAAGAIPTSALVAPTPGALRAILGPATGDGRGIRTVTLAPELPGSAEVAAELVRCGVRVSLGHSLARAGEARAAIAAGAVGATHLFNAMSGVHHRDMGLAGTALLERALFAEIIGDLAHVGAEAFELALAARGPQGLCLVSDALVGAGTGCDVFHSHGRAHRIANGAAYYPPAPGAAASDVGQLAGSASSQLDMLRRLVGRGVVGLEDALTMASASPARALGLDGELGVIAAGARADLVVLEGEELRLERVLVDGIEVPRA